MLQRLRCIAFTDSVHGTWGPDILSSAAKRFFVRHCVNWAQSEEPLDKLMEEPFLPAEDRGPEPEPEPKTELESLSAWLTKPTAAKQSGCGTGLEMESGTGISTEMETEKETEKETRTGTGTGTEREPGAEAEPMNVYDELLNEVSGNTKGKVKESGAMEGTESEGQNKEGLSEAVIVVPGSAEDKQVTAADVSAAAAGLGFFEEEAVNVSMEKEDVSMEKDEVGMDKDNAPKEKEDVSMGQDDVSMEEEAGGSRPDVPPEQTGQVFHITDKAGLSAAAERETDPGLKATLRKFAGQAGDDDVTEGPSGSGADVSSARGDVSRRGGAHGRTGGARGIVDMMPRGAGGRAGKREERGGRPVRKAQKTGFSWANLGRNKEYCRCLELSAGVNEHERTTYGALESVKKFLEEKLRAAGAELRSTKEVAVGGGVIEKE